MKLSLNIGTHGKIECRKICHHKAILSDCNLAEGGAAESKSSMVSSPWSLTSKEDNKVKHQPQQLDLRQTDPNSKYREGVSDVSPRKQCLTCIVGADDAPEVGTPGVMTATQQKCRQQPPARTGPCWMVWFPSLMGYCKSSNFLDQWYQEGTFDGFLWLIVRNSVIAHYFSAYIISCFGLKLVAFPKICCWDVHGRGPGYIIFICFDP